jgi:hypothetical protein
MIMIYHGFASLSPIFPSTLHHFRVPYEENNGIRVANGSAHGVGIYTASMESPQLSLGFIRPSSRARQLLVCGVLDDALRPSGELKSFGALTVKAESEAVRRGGNPWGRKIKIGMGWMGYAWVSQHVDARSAARCAR